MKKLLCILLACLIAALSTACKPHEETPEFPVTVYYRSSAVEFGTSSGVISPCIIDAAGYENDVKHLLNVYFTQPLSDKYQTTFPQNTHLVSIRLDALTANVVLCDEFAQLKGLELSIACACITRTILSLTDCQEVIISAENVQLDGHNFITLSGDSYLLLDESGVAE